MSEYQQKNSCQVKNIKSKRNQKSHLNKTKSINSIAKIIHNPRVWLALSIIVLLLLCTVEPLKFIFDSMFLIHYLQEHRCCIRIPFIVVYALLTVIGIPGTVLTIAGGVVFGLWY